jgi:prophage DNA circulation protein
MSGSLLSNLSAALGGLLGWRVALLPGSFNGVPFYMNTARGSGGRRLVTHEFPLRDIPALEDLGQKANEFRLQVFVVGNGYMAQRDALIAACQGSANAGILVHPTQGVISCRAGIIDWLENPKDQGGFCVFEIDFHKEGDQPAPFGSDSVSQLLGGVTSMISLAVGVYATVSAIVQNPALLLGYASTWLGELGGALLGLPAATIVGLSLAVGTITQAVINDLATGNAVQNVFQAAAANVITAQTPPVDPNDPIQGITPLIAAAADLTGGLAALATWGDTLTPPVGAGAALATLQAQQAAIVALVEGAATLAVMTVYANTDFVSANAATAARAQVLSFVDRQSAAANLAGNDNLYRAWLALGALAMQDFIQRAQNLPSLVAYKIPASRSSLVLAQLWYQDANRATELEVLNDAPHPLFMPTSGVRLSV